MLPDLASHAPEILIVAAVFLLAGAVKGVIGMGLPTIALGLLTATVGLETAMALILAPAITTNIWQGFVGTHVREVFRRLWPFFVPATLTIWLGVALAQVWPAALPVALLGGVLIAYGLLGLAKPALHLPARHDRWVAPLAGALNGIFSGLTATFVIPGLLYLQAQNLNRDQMVRALGQLFVLSTAMLALALAFFGRLPPEASLASLLSVFPAIAGMVAGSWLRRRLSEAAFRRVFFTALIGLGGYLLLPVLF